MLDYTHSKVWARFESKSFSGSSWLLYALFSSSLSLVPRFMTKLSITSSMALLSHNIYFLGNNKLAEARSIAGG
jgi:hypothetical protein